MKLVVPYVGELVDMDARLVRLAEFLGIPCETVALARATDHAESLKQALSDECLCFVVNPKVMAEWVGQAGIPAELIAFLLSRFTYLVVHGVRLNNFDTELVRALSRGKLVSINAISGERPLYEVANNSKRICGTFAGITFGPANPANDHVFNSAADDPAVEKLVSIGNCPFMASVKLRTTEILFLASEDVADLEAPVGETPLADYFSRFVPHVMALRYVAKDECWRPCRPYASIIIDDPLLQKSYGFLNFESLLRLAKRHNFHATIAFIPHNFRRNSSRITRMFKDNAEHLSICFHGNDHTGAEFGSTDLAFLHGQVCAAEDRMKLHQQITGLPCDRVMIFPQGSFSVEAMNVVKSHNFLAAVNRIPHPVGQPIQLTIGELAQPAVLRFGNFPLFSRNTIIQTQNHDIAFNLFFGRPVLIVEHHDLFQHTESLVQIVERINSLAPQVHWSNLATIVSNSVFERRSADGTHHVRSYSGTVRILNDSDSIKRYSIEWGSSWNGTPIEKVLVDGVSCSGFQVDDAGPRLSVELPPGSTQTFSLVHKSVHNAVSNLGLRWSARAFLRRRLSEVRDNYLSKNQFVLAAAKAFQRRFLRV